MHLQAREKFYLSKLHPQQYVLVSDIPQQKDWYNWFHWIDLINICRITGGPISLFCIFCW